MTTLASGSSTTFGLAVDQTFEMTFADGTTGTITVTGPLGSPYRTTFGPAKKNNWTPLPLGTTGRVVVACTAGSVSYTLGSSMFVTAITDAVTGRTSVTSGGIAIPTVARDNILYRNFAGIAHTGTVAETKLFSVLIKAGSIVAPAEIAIEHWFQFITTATAGTRQIRIGLNTADAVAGATNLIQIITTATSATHGINRPRDSIVFPTSTTQVGSTASNGYNAVAFVVANLTATLDTAADMYLIYSAVLSDVADSLAIRAVNITCRE